MYATQLYVTTLTMSDDYESKVAALSPEKALSVAAYGESVAAYRYRTLYEKSLSEEHRKVFGEMADEETGHHVRVQDLTKRHFPGSDFVLKAKDKELVVVGPRLLEVTDQASFDRALNMIYETERLTGRFYEALHGITTNEELRPFLKEMAEECFEHAERLKEIPPLN